MSKRSKVRLNETVTGKVLRVTENLDKLTVPQLKERIVAAGIRLKDIKGSGANGNVLKADLVRALIDHEARSQKGKSIALSRSSSKRSRGKSIDFPSRSKKAHLTFSRPKRLLVCDEDGHNKCPANHVCHASNGRCLKLTKNGRPFGEAALIKGMKNYQYNDRYRLLGESDDVNAHVDFWSEGQKSRRAQTQPVKPPQSVRPETVKRKSPKRSLTCDENGHNKCPPRFVCRTSDGKCVKKVKGRPIGESTLRRDIDDYYYDDKYRLVGERDDVNAHIDFWNMTRSKKGIVPPSSPEEEISEEVVAKKKDVAKHFDTWKKLRSMAKAPSPKKPSPPKYKFKKCGSSTMSNLDYYPPCEDNEMCDIASGKCVDGDNIDDRDGQSMLDINGRIIVGDTDTIKRLQKKFGGEIKIIEEEELEEEELEEEESLWSKEESWPEEDQEDLGITRRVEPQITPTPPIRVKPVPRPRPSETINPVPQQRPVPIKRKSPDPLKIRSPSPIRMAVDSEVRRRKKVSPLKLAVLPKEKSPLPVKLQSPVKKIIEPPVKQKSPSPVKIPVPSEVKEKSPVKFNNGVVLNASREDIRQTFLQCLNTLSK